MEAARYARIWRVDVLAGAGDIPWATVDRWVGGSDDIPDLLRETAAGSEEALEELGGYMVHQGTLYLVTPYLVRFLARIAASGVATERILDLLGVVASFDDAGQAPEVRGGTRAALAEASTALSPLLGDPSDVVRTWRHGRCRRAWRRTASSRRCLSPGIRKSSRRSPRRSCAACRSWIPPGRWPWPPRPWPPRTAPSAWSRRQPPRLAACPGPATRVRRRWRGPRTVR